MEPYTVFSFRVGLLTLHSISLNVSHVGDVHNLFNHVVADRNSECFQLGVTIREVLKCPYRYL